MPDAQDPPFEDPDPIDPEDLEDDPDIDDEESGDDGDPDEDRPVKGPPGATDPDEEIAHPDTKVPSHQKMLDALERAFEAEEGIEDGLLAQYARHAELVLEANRRMNLTAILDPYEVAVKHYLDSWRATRLLPLMGRSVLDLGSGAGFPGYPIAIAEMHTRVVLCDSTRKRVEFIEECIEKLGTKNVSAVWDRAEEHLARNKYDIVIVRAVSSVRENVRVLRKVRHSHKDLVMLKGPSWSREARAGEREVERLGFRLDTVWEHELPDELGKRAVLVYRAPGGMGE
jgi:16S rRNA (guanine527-N7)-methyltransferase